MEPSDRLLTSATCVIGFGLASLTMLSGLLGWSLIVQNVLVLLLVVVPLTMDRVTARVRSRRR